MLLIGIFPCMMTHYDFISIRNVQVSLEGSDIGIVYRNSHYFQRISGFMEQGYPQAYFTFSSWISKGLFLVKKKLFGHFWWEKVCNSIPCKCSDLVCVQGVHWIWIIGVERSTRKLNYEPNSDVTWINSGNEVGKSDTKNEFHVKEYYIWNETRHRHWNLDVYHLHWFFLNLKQSVIIKADLEIRLKLNNWKQFDS